MRDLSVAYLLTLLVYIYVGCMGYLCIFNKHSAFEPQTIMDLFPKDDVGVFLVSFLFSIFLFCIQPLLLTISRNQFFNLFYKDFWEVPVNYKLAFNALFALLCIVLGVFRIDPSTLLR